jgi:hypothetical protein
MTSIAVICKAILLEEQVISFWELEYRVFIHSSAFLWQILRRKPMQSAQVCSMTDVFCTYQLRFMWLSVFVSVRNEWIVNVRSFCHSTMTYCILWHNVL